jgi:hypothetical protein
MLMRQKRESGKKGKKNLNNKLHIFKQLCNPNDCLTVKKGQIRLEDLFL